MSGSTSGNKIEHVVVLMLENRSFDHLMGYFPGAQGLTGHEYNLLDPTRPESETNPRFSVGPHATWRIKQGQGPGHTIGATNEQQTGTPHPPSADTPARHNGFVSNYRHTLLSDRVADPSPDILGIPMQAFTPEKLPALSTLAREFVLCDRWFSEVPGPTQPNRLYVHAATSQGYAHNVWSHVFDCRTIYNSLENAGKTWAVYYTDDNDVAKFSRVEAKSYTEPEEEAAWEQDRAGGVRGAFLDYHTFFAKHAAEGKLANYVFIEPSYGDSGETKGWVTSMHPPNDVRPGDHLVADVYEALRANEDTWRRTLLVITFDEHGGYYDHVAPPAAPNPDGKTSPPPGESAYAPHFAFDRLGLRVPTLLISPWLPKGRIDSTPYQHTSILATVRHLYSLPDSLTRRDASATSFHPLLEEVLTPRTDTPRTLARPPLDETVNPDDPSHPANLAPDELLREKVEGWHRLTQHLPDGAPTSETPPQRTRDAHHFIRDQVKRFATYRSGKTRQIPPRRRKG